MCPGIYKRGISGQGQQNFSPDFVKRCSFTTLSDVQPGGNIFLCNINLLNQHSCLTERIFSSHIRNPRQPGGGGRVNSEANDHVTLDTINFAPYGVGNKAIRRFKSHGALGEVTEMQAARSSAPSGSAILPLASVQALFKFNANCRDFLIPTCAPNALSGRVLHRGNQWLINSRTGTAGRFHCEGSTK